MRQEMKGAVLLAVLLMLTACGKGGPDADDAVKKHEAAKEDGAGLELTAEQSEALGLTTAKLSAVSYRAQLTGYGAVMAVDGIAQSDADTAVAEAAVTQSAAAAARAKDLSTGDDAAVSRETYEAAAAKAATDQAAVVLVRRKADAVFGINAPWHNATQRSNILARLQAGRTVLVKVTFPIGAVVESKNFSVTRMGVNGQSHATATVWEAPADATIPGRSLFALVDDASLAPGERIIATIAVGAAQPGVVVPATALVLGESEAWVYVKKNDSYVRTRIDISHPEGDGYFVAEGLEPDQEVVIGGAGQLYAREINPSVEPD